MQYSLNFGEFGIEELKIASPSGGVADLLTDVLVIEINIFEDIFKSTISGTITMSDIRDVITSSNTRSRRVIYKTQDTIIDCKRRHHRFYCEPFYNP